jgi:Fe-S-cluster-containing dehydrogenase component
VKLKFQPEKCIGCHLCELACSGYKEGVFNPALARLLPFKIID